MSGANASHKGYTLNFLYALPPILALGAYHQAMSVVCQTQRVEINIGRELALDDRRAARDQG